METVTVLGAGLAGSDIAEGGSQTPDHTSEHTDEVGPGAAFEIVRELHRRAHKRLFHDKRSENEMARKHRKGEDDQR